MRTIFRPGHMRRGGVNRRLVGLAVLLAGTEIGAAQTSNVPPRTRASEDLTICAQLIELAYPTDYRTRDSTPQLRWRIQDVKLAHYDPAVKRMQQGEYSHSVMADLDYLLRHWPNHLPGLEALIQYDLRGGKVYEFAPAHCYFELAREFAPDDAGVLLHEGYYFWKKKNSARAIEIFEAALAVDPKSVDAHYSLGLLYFESGEYDKAVVHARAAYDAGYPLPGLKRKLQQAGHWGEAKPQ
jgi:tetratricopeptide (TPR) repeat protein